MYTRRVRFAAALRRNCRQNGGGGAGSDAGAQRRGWVAGPAAVVAASLQRVQQKGSQAPSRQRPTPATRSGSAEVRAAHVSVGSGVVDGVQDRQPWWPASLSALCAMGGQGEKAKPALDATAQHIVHVLAIPEKWQPIDEVIDSARIGGLAAAQFKAAGSHWPAEVQMAMVCTPHWPACNCYVLAIQ